MDADEYLKKRLEPEIAWYDRRSGQNKTRYVCSRLVEIISASFIPLISGYTSKGDPSLSVVVGGLGGLVAISGGVSSLLKFQENWIKYRTTAESLKKEKYLYQTKVEPYDSSDPLPILVQRVETLVSQENTNWAQYMMKPGKEDKNG